jgi:hypothetical protein
MHRNPISEHTDTPTTQSDCTANVETVNVRTVEARAAPLLVLAPADRARLAGMLLASPTNRTEGEAATAAAEASQPRRTNVDR